MMMCRKTTAVVTLAAYLGTAGVALAHGGAHEAAGLVSGFVHPLGGPDHLAAMLAVGALAQRSGGRATWAAPALFLLSMAAGAAAIRAGWTMPFAELAVAVSVLGFGTLLLVHRSRILVPLWIAAGGFGAMHGAVHMAEMPADGSSLPYAAGFLLATALLVCAGSLGARAALHASRLSRQAGLSGP